MYLYSKSLICFFLFSYSICISQTKPNITKIFDLVEKHYEKKESYSYKMNYSFYEKENDKKAIESFQGLVLKYGNIKYQKLNNVEFIDFGDKNVMLNHDDKLLQISKIENNNSPILIKTFLNLFPTHEVVEQDSRFICTLSSKNISQTNISKVVIYINKKDYSLEKEEFVYFGKKEVSTQNKTTTINSPKLEILFLPRKIDDANDKELIKKANYYYSQGDKIVPSNKYKTYKLIVY